MPNRGWVLYQQDDGLNKAIRATSTTATANGQTLTPAPATGLGWDYNYKDLRHLTGVTTDGLHRARMTILDPTLLDDAIGTFTWSDSYGKVYTCTSTFGEKKPAQDRR